jgi:hypothetical protein
VPVTKMSKTGQLDEDPGSPFTLEQIRNAQEVVTGIAIGLVTFDHFLPADRLTAIIDIPEVLAPCGLVVETRSGFVGGKLNLQVADPL